MSASYFTPGPWWVPPGEDRSGIHVPINSNPHNIATAYFVNGRANAHLIAAAPDLYEALENFTRVANLDERRAAFNRAVAVLAKARGEA